MTRVISLTLTIAVAACVAAYITSCMVSAPPVACEAPTMHPMLVVPAAYGPAAAPFAPFGFGFVGGPQGAQRCAPGASCNFECAGGDCSFDCASGSTCNADCDGGDCKLACESGATCTFECSGGDCETTCDGGSTCNVDCTGGSCSAICAPGASCAGECTGGSCT